MADQTSPESQAQLAAFIDSIKAPPSTAAKFLTPEMIERLNGPDIEMQKAEIAHRRAMADALRQGSGHQYTTRGGSIFGGIGDIFKARNASRKEEEAAAAQKQMMDQDQAQRAAEMALLQKMYGGQSSEQAAPHEAQPSAGISNSELGLGDYSLQIPDLAQQGAGPSLEQKLMAQALAKKPKSTGTLLPLTDEEAEEAEEAEGAGGGGY